MSSHACSKRVGARGSEVGSGGGDGVGGTAVGGCEVVGVLAGVAVGVAAGAVGVEGVVCKLHAVSKSAIHNRKIVLEIIICIQSGDK